MYVRGAALYRLKHLSGTAGRAGDSIEDQVLPQIKIFTVQLGINNLFFFFQSMGWHQTTPDKHSNTIISQVANSASLVSVILYPVESSLDRCAMNVKMPYSVERHVHFFIQTICDHIQAGTIPLDKWEILISPAISCHVEYMMIEVQMHII